MPACVPSSTWLLLLLDPPSPPSNPSESRLDFLVNENSVVLESFLRFSDQFSCNDLSAEKHLPNVDLYVESFSGNVSHELGNDSSIAVVDVEAEIKDAD